MRRTILRSISESKRRKNTDPQDSNPNSNSNNNNNNSNLADSADQLPQDEEELVVKSHELPPGTEIIELLQQYYSAKLPREGELYQFPLPGLERESLNYQFGVRIRMISIIDMMKEDSISISIIILCPFSLISYLFSIIYYLLLLS